MRRVARGRAGSRAWWRSAAARLTGPAQLSMPMTRLRKVAMTWGGHRGGPGGGLRRGGGGGPSGAGSRIVAQTAPMGSQRAGKQPLVGREGLFCMVAAVEGLRKVPTGAGGAPRGTGMWPTAPEGGLGTARGVGGGTGGAPSGGGVLAGGHGPAERGGPTPDDGDGDGAATREGR